MQHQPTFTADPIASLAQAILDNGEYRFSDLYTRSEWKDAADFYFDDGLGAEQMLANMAAQDKAFADYPAGDTYRDGPDVTEWLADNTRPAETTSVVGMVSA